MVDRLRGPPEDPIISLKLNHDLCDLITLFVFLFFSDGENLESTPPTWSIVRVWVNYKVYS